MMKLKTYFLALAALTFAACQQDDTPTMQEQELRIATRSETGGETSEPFTDDFTLVLSSTTDNTKYETHQMTYTDGAGWNTVVSSILPAHAFAYKGSSVTYITYRNQWNYYEELQLDQSDAAKLADADVMIATGSANAESPLELNFRHIFAKVTFNATLADEFGEEDEITAVDVKTVYRETVKAYVDGKTVSAIINPGGYSAGNDFLSVTVSDADDPLTVIVPTGGLTFTAGTHYTFELKVGKDKVTLTEVSASNDFPGNWYDNDNYYDDVNLNN